MDYEALTVEDRVALLTERLKGYEAQHFDQAVELMIAEDLGPDYAPQAQSARAKVQAFERAIELTRIEIDGLKS